MSLALLWQRTLGRLPVFVCDVGAGTGRFTLALLRNGIACAAVEPDRAMSGILRREARNRGLAPPNLVLQRFEEATVPVGAYESLILMTDTLSYVPVDRLDTFVAACARALRSGGIALFDVALWRPGSSDRLDESWSREVFGGTVRARAESQVVVRDGSLARTEVLSFHFRDPRGCVSARRRRTLNAFTLDRLERLMTTAGFEFESAVEPGAIQEVRPLNAHRGRLMLAFRRR